MASFKSPKKASAAEPRLIFYWIQGFVQISFQDPVNDTVNNNLTHIFFFRSSALQLVWLLSCYCR